MYTPNGQPLIHQDVIVPRHNTTCIVDRHGFLLVTYFFPPFHPDSGAGTPPTICSETCAAPRALRLCLGLSIRSDLGGAREDTKMVLDVGPNNSPFPSQTATRVRCAQRRAACPRLRRLPLLSSSPINSPTPLVTMSQSQGGDAANPPPIPMRRTS